MVREINYEVKASDAGKSIYNFLRDRFYSYKILTLFRHREASILLNGSPALMKSELNISDKLTVIYEESDESENIIPTDLPFEIVYEDEDIMVVNKPADMPVHPAINNFDNTLANALTFYFQSKGEKLVFRCINRLDRNTSGLLIVAKHRLSASILSDFMKKREIHREYVALAGGLLCQPHPSESAASSVLCQPLSPTTYTIDAPIGRVSDSIIERFVDYENGAPAVTHYEIIKSYEDVTPFLKSSPGRDFIATCPPYTCRELIVTCPPYTCPATLIKLHLETGRTHQIRVHMRHINHPLIGDSLYNKEPGPLSSQALHSYRLDFIHPITLEKMSFTSDSIPFINDDEINL